MIAFEAPSQAIISFPPVAHIPLPHDPLRGEVRELLCYAQWAGSVRCAENDVPKYHGRLHWGLFIGCTQNIKPQWPSWWHSSYVTHLQLAPRKNILSAF